MLVSIPSRRRLLTMFKYVLAFSSKSVWVTIAGTPCLGKVAFALAIIVLREDLFPDLLLEVVTLKVPRQCPRMAVSLR